MEENKIGIESIYISKEVMKLIQSGELTLQEGFVLSIIDFLNTKGECFASNEFLGKSISVSSDRAKKIVSSLYNKKYIDRKIIYKSGTKEVDKRILKPNIKININNIPGVENNLGVGVKTTPPGGKNNHIDKSIDKSINNIYIYSSSNNEIKEIINLWNSKNITECNKETKKLHKEIDKAIKEYNLKEIKEAIDNYDTVLKDKDYYYDHIYKLENFIDKGLNKFVKDGEHYLNYKNKSITNLEDKPKDRIIDINFEGKSSNDILKEFNIKI